MKRYLLVEVDQWNGQYINKISLVRDFNSKHHLKLHIENMFQRAVLEYDDEELKNLLQENNLYIVDTNDADQKVECLLSC
jgi:hypothetical protein